MQKFISILIGLLLASLLKGETGDYGVQFFNHRHSPDLRTYIRIPAKKAINLPSGYQVKFDLKILNERYFGYLFSISTNRGDMLLVSFDPFEDQDSIKLNISVNSQPQKIIFTFKKGYFKPLRWMNFDLSIDSDRSILKVKLGSLPEEELELQPFNLTPAIFYFGATTFQIESPAMLIRDFIVKSGEKIFGHWTFKSNPNNKISGQDGFLKDGLYLEKAVNSPQLIYEVKENPVAGVDLYILPDNDTLFLASGNRLILTDQYGYLYDDIKLKYDYKDLFRLEPFFDTYHNRILSIFNGHSQISELDRVSGQWMNVDTSGQVSAYNGLKHMINPQDGKIYGFGGYGYFAVRNDLLCYNFQKSKWDIVKSINPPLRPRAGFLLSSLIDNKYYYIAGGRGNNSGKQSDGLVPLHDMWRIDITNLQFEQITSTISVPGQFIIKIGDFNTSDSCLYFTGNMLEPRDHTHYTFYKYQIFSGKLEKLNEIEVNEDETITALKIKNNVLYSTRIVNLRNHEAYTTLLFRTILKNSETPNLFNFSPVFAIYTIILTLILVPIGITVYFQTRKRRRNAEKKRTREFKADEISITTFGTFQINCANSDNNNLKLTNKSEEVLAYLIIFASSLEKAVSTKKLTSDIWPLLDVQSAKNARGISIYRLRQSLYDYPEIKIENSNRGWGLFIGENVNIDFLKYREYSKILKYCMKDTIKDKIEFVKDWLNIIKTGVFFKGHDNYWLDPFRAELEQDILEIGHEVIACLYATSNYIMVEKTAKILLIWNPIDELTERYLLKSLVSENRIAEAYKHFESFRKSFQDLYDKPYSIDFEAFIKQS